MIKSNLVNAADGTSLLVINPHEGQPRVHGDEHILVVEDVAATHGNFKSIAVNTAGNFSLAAPTDEGSLYLTDLLISAERRNGGVVTVKFTDGTNEVPVFSAIVTDAPANVTIPFNGRWQGWQNARIDITVTAATVATIALGYVKIPRGLPFEEWDALR